MNFEDVIWLFTSDEHTRGIVRLNIAEGALLYKYSKKVQGGILLEIGRKYGGSTMLILAALGDGKLYSIDIVMHDCVSGFVEEFRDRVDLITADSKKIKWYTCLDLVFIDGDHSYGGVKADIKKFLPWVNAGGYAIFHDVVGKKSTLQPLINELLTDWEYEDEADSMLVIKRKKDGRNFSKI